MILRDGKRYKIPTQRILDSWNFPVVINASEAALAKYPIAFKKVGFRDGSLLNNIKDGKLYLVSDASLRTISSPDVLTRLGLSKDNATVVSDAEISMMRLGDDIT